VKLPRPRWTMRRLRPDIGFGAFISYSGQEDRALITKLQNGIEKLAKRWYRPPITKVFVDKTSIAAGTRLWSRIEYGLTRSRWLILMASPEAAQSWWVDREVEWWLTHRSLDNVIIVHTAGDLSWDRDAADFSATSTAIPPCLRGKFDDEPVWTTVLRSDRSPNVEGAVLSIASAVRQTPIHELSSQAYREHRRTLRWAGSAIGTLSLLLVAALVLSIVAVVQKRHADAQARIALSRQLASTSTTLLSTNPRASMLVAVSAYRTDANPQTLAALMRADTENPRLVRYFSAGTPVTELTGSGDGKTLVAGLSDGRVVRWGLGDSQPTTVIKLSSAIASLGVSGDASVIAAADKSTAELWHSGQNAVPLKVPAGQSANAVTVSPSGKIAVVNGYIPRAFEGEQSSTVFDVATVSRRAVHPSAGSEILIAYLVASSDDDLLIFDDAYGRWQRRRISDWALTGSGSVDLGTHQKAGEPSANGEFVSATNGATSIPVWRLNSPPASDSTPSDLMAQAPITGGGDSLALSEDGTTLAIADAGSIYVAPITPGNAFDTAGPMRASAVQLPGAGTIGSVGLLRFLGDGSHLVSATGDQIALWDLHQIDRLARTTTSVLESNPCNACAGTQVGVSPDDKHAALMATSAVAIQPLPGVVGLPHRLRNVCDSGPLVGGEVGGCGIPLWRKDGRLIIVTGQSAQDTSTGGSGAVRVLTVPSGKGVMAAGLAADERTVVAVDSNGSIFRLDTETGQARETISGPPPLKDGLQNLQDASVDATADLVVTVQTTDSDNLQGSVSLVDLRNHRTIGSIAGDDFVSARFAGPLLLVQRKSGNLEVWDERARAMLRVIGGDRSYFYPPVGDRRGQLVARLRGENAIELFDLTTGASVDSIPSFPGSVKTGYTFSLDGALLVTDIARESGGDILVSRDLSAKGLLAAACAASGSKLSSQEWQALVGMDPRHVPTCS
jgi:WD40 repeat protein